MIKTEYVLVISIAIRCFWRSAESSTERRELCPAAAVGHVAGSAVG